MRKIAKAIIICELCGKIFSAQRSAYRRFCSLSCSTAYNNSHGAGFSGRKHSKYTKKLISKSGLGRNIGNKYGWKGGILRSNGYYWIHSPHHPRKNKCGKGYVRRCCLVVEKYLGRFLTKVEIVHHINNDRTDDRIENLMVLSRGEHSRLHNKQRSLPRNKKGQFMKGGDVYAVSA